ncbi:MAG: DNA mismatch repair protein MutS [Anaerolineae bacterium]
MARPTPLYRQYLQIKQQYPDAILFFRLGDFYETFDEDARIAARELDLVLTGRQLTAGASERNPMAGVPHHAVEGYIAKLIEKGYRVAICEQVGEPVGGLMPREVVRVVTPGTVVEPGLLEDKRNNYLAAVALDHEHAGIAYVDITTGEFRATQLSGKTPQKLARQELERIGPAECLVPETDDGPAIDLAGDDVSASREFVVTPYTDWHFDLETARRTLLDHFGVASLAGYGLEESPWAIRAAGAIIQYLADTAPSTGLRASISGVAQITGLSTYTLGSFMTLDAATRRNLELTESIRGRSERGSLLHVLDSTQTAMGGRLLRSWLNQPLLSVNALNRRLDAVEVFTQNTPTRTEIIGYLKNLSDLERLTNRVLGGIAGPRDLAGLRSSLERVPAILTALNGLERLPDALADLRLDPCEEVTDLVRRAIVEDPPATLSKPGVIASGYSQELDSIAEASRDAKDWIAGLERRERKRTGVRSLKVGFNKVFGYYIEVTKPNLSAVPSDYHRKQTLVNSERFITPELKEYEARVLNAEERILEIEARLFSEVCAQVQRYSERLLGTAQALAHLDVYAALAEVALRRNYVRPALSEDGRLDIRAGRHPVVEALAGDRRGALAEPFVPNDARMEPGEIVILTGPNMSGKSTFLRQVAIIVLMAQIGSFVPADQAAIGIVDRIFTRIGAQDEIAAGQSTFMVEMVETANILNNATGRSLVILDEIGRGTSTYDGISIAWAVVEHIHNHPQLRAKTLFATHYHELTELAERLPRVRNFNVAVAEEGDDVVFLHRIVPGGADRSYGIHVAELAGLPRTVVRRARHILTDLEAEARAPDALVRKVDQDQNLQLPLFSPQSAGDGRLAELAQALRELDVAELTPLEAINKLYELQQEATEIQNDQT